MGTYTNISARYHRHSSSVDRINTFSRRISLIRYRFGFS